MIRKNIELIIQIIFLVLITIIAGIFLLKDNVDDTEVYRVHYDKLNNLYSKINLKTTNFKEETLNNINQTNDNLALAEYYDSLTRYYILNNDLQTAKGYSDKAIERYNKIEDKDNYILNTYKNISILDINQGNNNKSLDYYNKMLEVSKKKEIIKESVFTKEDIEGLSYAMLTIFYSRNSNSNKASEYYKCLNKLDNKNIHDKEIEYIMSYAKSMYNTILGDKNKAEKDSVDLYNEVDNSSMNLNYIKPSVYLNKSVIQILNGHFENALVGVDKTIKLNNNVKNDLLIECYLIYGLYYDKRDMFEEGKMNYEKALSLSEEIGSNIQAARSIVQLIELCEKSNKEIENEAYYKKYWKISMDKENGANSYISSIISLNDKLDSEKVSILENEKKSEEQKHKMMKLALIFTALALVIFALCIYKLFCEIKLRKESEVKLKKTIDEDYLTKAYTRGYAYEQLKYMIEDKQSIYLAMIDLDNYKRINDNFGHDIGDWVLVSCVEICKTFLNEEDFIARFGGEEFLIILKNKSRQDAIKIVENIRKSLDDKEWNLDRFKITASIGLVYNKYDNVDDLIKKADELLYVAKRTGKNKVQIE